MAYRTVKQSSEIEHVVKRSKFLGRCFPVSCEQEALILLEKLRKQHWDATHNCYAYSIGETGAIARFSDDGEPSGTAGMPMLEAMRRIGITNALVVVTRYFGGILLGAGGLVRAYTAATVAAIEAAGQIEMRQCCAFSLSIPYNRWGKMEIILRELAQVEEVRYGSMVEVDAWVLCEEIERFRKKIIDRSDGTIEPISGTTMTRAFEINSPCGMVSEIDEE